MTTSSPGCKGLRPTRALRWRVSNTPKFRNSTFSPRHTASRMTSNDFCTTANTCCCPMSKSLLIRITKSRFVIFFPPAGR